MNRKIDLKGLIPSGNELRILLNSKHISEGEINFTLKGKGIFCGSGDKIFSVPLLSATLLTSNEYENIIDKSIARNLKPKNKMSKLELTDNDANWQESLKNLLTPDFNPFLDIPNIEPTKKPILTVIEKNKIKIRYEIKRKDFSKDFINRELDFYGEIFIEKQDADLKLESIYTHTSKETELINRRIGVAIAKKLKDSGITKSDVEDGITFDSFQDIERVRFFKRLTGGLETELRLDNVDEIVISREASITPLPDDPKVSWMNDTVKYMTIDGDRLHNIFLMADEKYYQYYFINNMALTYKYAVNINLGSVKVCFYFSSSSRKKNTFDNKSELIFEIDAIKYENETTISSRNKIKEEISEKIRFMIKNEYEKILNERKNNSAIAIRESSDSEIKDQQYTKDLFGED